jgi:sodium/hydrogen exchanger 8
MCVCARARACVRGGAGYTMRKRKFFQNFGTIMLLGVVGSIVTSISISGVLYYLQQNAMPGLCAGNTESGRHDALDCIILGTILCNVDLVATLSVMSPTETPQLYSILFGEGVINDAVSIVLFDASLKAGLSDHEDWSDGVQQIILHFFLLLFGSIILGVLCGLVCSFTFKRTRIAKDTKRAVSVFALFAYGSYLLAEVLEMSGIMSVFFCGISMAHYNWYNLSASARLVTSQTFQSVSYACEMFVFCYMGFSVWTLSFEETLGKGRKANWSLPLIVTSAMTTWMVRGFTSVIFCGIANRFRTKQIPPKEQVVIFFSGTMRGCVAFALALKVDEDGLDANGEALESGVFSTTILAISIFTTLAFGGVSAPILQALGLKKPHGGHGGHHGEQGAVGGPAAGALQQQQKQQQQQRRQRQPLLKKLSGAAGAAGAAGAGASSLGDPLLMSSPSYDGLRTGSMPSPLSLLDQEIFGDMDMPMPPPPDDSPMIAVDESIEQEQEQQQLAGSIGGVNDGDEAFAGGEEDGAILIDGDGDEERVGGLLHMRHRMIASEEDVTDSAGKLFRHPSAVGNYEGEGEGGGLNMQSAGGQSGGSPKSGKFGKLHRL